MTFYMGHVILIIISLLTKPHCPRACALVLSEEPIRGFTASINQLYFVPIPFLKLVSSKCLTVSDWRQTGIQNADEQLDV